MKGYIRKILKSSAVDGPGNRMVLFFQGCNFNCTYCHNPETIPLFTASAKDDVQEMTVEEVVAEVERVRPFISGVTVSGGECTIQFAFLLALANQLKDKEISLFVDTNGTLPVEKMAELAALVDAFMLDVKALDPPLHLKLIGQGNKNVLKNLTYLAKEHKLYEVRTVIIPGVVDNEAVVDYVSGVLADYDAEIRYKLIQYRPHGVRDVYVDGYDSPTEAYMASLKERAEAKGLKKVIVT